ncbi:MAG: extracellular solute-binding protein [Dongiaceae bacterium]
MSRKVGAIGAKRARRGGLTRRQFLGAGAALAGGGVLAASGIRPVRAAGGEITIFTWETYHDNPWLEEYTKKTGVKVNVVRTGSVDELYAQTRSGAVEADILYVDTGSVPRYIKAGLISPFDAAKVPNAKNITQNLDWQKILTVDGKLWGAPYNWGTQPLMYDTKAVTPAPTSWKVLWDEKYKGKVNMFDDAYVTFPMIALYVGAKDAYNLTDAEFDLCRKALADLRPQIRTIARGFDDAATIYAAGDAVVGYCQNIAVVSSLQAKGLPFAYGFPDEGTPTWIDCSLLTPRGQRQEVYDFVNENLTVPWQARFIQTSTNNGVLSAAEAKAAGIPEEVLKKTNIIDQDQAGFWQKMSIFQPPENIDRRLEIWNEFKAGTL